MPSKSMLDALTFRTADQHDCDHLVLLADMATRGLTSYLWRYMAAPGQSAFEIGRNAILYDEDHFVHFRNWRVAEDDNGKIVGALNAYAILEPSSSSAPTLEVVKPLNELKAMATGTWYISAAAIYPEHQGKGYGKSLLAEAENLACAASKNCLTLMVGSFNTRAYSLYRRAGFIERDRRTFIAFPGSDESGEWILMIKNLA